MYKKGVLLLVALVFVGLVVSTTGAMKTRISEGDDLDSNKVLKTEDEWKGCLSPEEYRVLREKGTEMAFTGKYYKHDEDGTYHCAGCGNELFSSETKYESGSGWPSFYTPLDSAAVKEKSDNSYGMVRTEIVCKKCDSHLGHVFSDGPDPTGLRYCVNSVSLDFKKKDSMKKNKSME